MTTPAPTSELARAAELLQARDRDAAGRLLKAYLTDHPRDADAWWLMSQAVNQPANVRTCLERVLRLRPGDARAQARLAQLSLPDEPDDSFFVAKAPPAPAATPQPPARTAPASSDAPVPFDPTLDLGVSFDPFADLHTGTATDAQDPFAALCGQQPGTGHQPDWGPGLGFVSERPAAAAQAEKQTARRKPSNTAIGVVVVVFALIALVGVLLVVAKQRGWINLGGLPAMQTLDAGAFTLDFPEDWGGVCLSDPQGYPVCGVSNDPRYNEVNLYSGQQVDMGQMMSSAIGSLLDFEEAPDLVLSVIAMDVPETSNRYFHGSQAQMSYELYRDYGSLGGDDYALDYDERDPTIDGHSARVYRLTMDRTSDALTTFVMGGGGDAALYDVYIPHDGKMFWMTVQVYAFSDRQEIPHDVIEHMIDSIDLKTS